VRALRKQRGSRGKRKRRKCHEDANSSFHRNACDRVHVHERPRHLRRGRGLRPAVGHRRAVGQGCTEGDDRGQETASRLPERSRRGHEAGLRGVLPLHGMGEARVGVTHLRYWRVLERKLNRIKVVA